jgi:hypothetical protein
MASRAPPTDEERPRGEPAASGTRKLAQLESLPEPTLESNELPADETMLDMGKMNRPMRKETQRITGRRPLPSLPREPRVTPRVEDQPQSDEPREGILRERCSEKSNPCDSRSSRSTVPPAAGKSTRRRLVATRLGLPLPRHRRHVPRRRLEGAPASASRTSGQIAAMIRTTRLSIEPDRVLCDRRGRDARDPGSAGHRRGPSDRGVDECRAELVGCSRRSGSRAAW